MTGKKLDWRFQVRRVYLDADGYDDNGAYYGAGQKVWEVEFAGNQNTGLGNGFNFTEAHRAVSKQAVVAKILARDSRYRHVRDIWA